MAEYVPLASLGGVELPDGRLISASTLQGLLGAYLGPRGPPRDRPPVVDGPDDPHLITKGRYKGRLQFLLELDGSVSEFFRYYREGKYLSIDTLRRAYIPHPEPRRRRLQDLYIKNIQQYGKDALAHVCIPSFPFTNDWTVSGLLARDNAIEKDLFLNARGHFAATYPPTMLDHTKPIPRRKPSEVPEPTHADLQGFRKPWARWFHERFLVEEWLRLPE